MGRGFESLNVHQSCVQNRGVGAEASVGRETFILYDERKEDIRQIAEDWWIRNKGERLTEQWRRSANEGWLCLGRFGFWYNMRRGVQANFHNR